MRWLNLFGNQIEKVDEVCMALLSRQKEKCSHHIIFALPFFLSFSLLQELFADMKSYFVSSPKAKSIRLSYNKIKKFPKIFTQMLCLQELHLAGNDIDGFFSFFLFPFPFFSPSSSLIFFFSFFFFFPEIPEEIGGMRDLLVLSFANNGSELVLPDSISKLKKLRKMYLRLASNILYFYQNIAHFLPLLRALKEGLYSKSLRVLWM